VWPNLSPGQYPLPGTLGGAIIYADPNSGRPARQIQWSASVQREFARSLALELAYVGNRGVWWDLGTSLLQNLNAITPAILAHYGLDLNNPDDRQLLTSRLNSPVAIARGFGNPPYPGFALTNTVAQSLRPYPQFLTIGETNSTLGDTWYNALQAKATERLSHGLEFTVSFAWQKSEEIGADSAGLFSAAVVNDPFQYRSNKYLAGLDQPFTSTIAARYSLPAWGPKPWVSQAVRDWQIGAVLSYASGLPIQVPLSQGNQGALIFAPTFANRVPGQPLFTQDLNCHCFDPNKTFVLNPAAWTEPAPGQFASSAAFYSDYRYQRRPSEGMSLGRLFQIRERVRLQVRAEFTNIFNRTEMNNPTSTNAQATQTRNNASQTISGFGYVNTGTLFSPSRQGTLVARFEF